MKGPACPHGTLSKWCEPCCLRLSLEALVAALDGQRLDKSSEAALENARSLLRPHAVTSTDLAQ